MLLHLSARHPVMVNTQANVTFLINSIVNFNTIDTHIRVSMDVIPFGGSSDCRRKKSGNFMYLAIYRTLVNPTVTW